MKPIQRRRRGKQRQSPSLQPNQEEPSQPEGVSRSKDAHLQTELGSTSRNESFGDLEDSLPSSSSSNGETQESGGKRRSYDSILEEIQAIFAGQKVKKKSITSYVHLCQRQRERKSNKPKQRERSQAHLPATNQHASTSKPRTPARARSPSDGNLSSLLQPCKWRYKTEPICKRVLAQLPSEDESRCSFDPLGISPSQKAHATQSSTHQLGEHSKREHISRGEAARYSSPPGSASTKRKNQQSRHGAVDNHHEACRRTSAERNTHPRVDNDCYHDVLRLYEECHIHETTTLITSPGSSRKPQRHSYEERGFQTQPQQIVYSCHQHVCQQTVVRHREGCHLHQRDDLELPSALSPKPSSSRRCQRCGCTQQDYPAEKEESLQGVADYNACHSPPKDYVKTGSRCEQKVTACAQRLFSCNMHGDGCQRKLDVCGIVHHQDLQRKVCEDRNCPICQHPCKEHDASLVKRRCHLHPDSPRPPSPKCQEPKEPLVWTPRRVWKAKPCSVHWLDRKAASQSIPSHIVRQYLQGKRRCPPRWKKQKCLACVGKLRDGDPCQREGTKPAWNSGSDIAESTVECKEWKERRGKLSRLALSRVLIVKPVPKVSTSQGLWTRKEFEVCSECRDLKLFRSIGIKSGRWPSLLETMSTTGCREEGEMSSNCSTRFSCHTAHGLSIPDTTRSMDLRGPELNSAFRLRAKLQKLQNETFDRRAAMQVAQMEGITLDKEVFDLLPESNASQKGNFRRTHTVRRRKRWEVYRGLSKIVELPMPPCQQCPLREVGVQADKRDLPPLGNAWNPSDFCPEVQSSLQFSTPNTTNCCNQPGQDHSNSQAQDQSFDEQHWAYLVEACRQTRRAQGPACQ